MRSPRRIPWVALQPGDGAAVTDLQLSDDVRQRIRDDLAAGYIAVAPTSPVSMDAHPFSGWWRIDPRSGSTLAMGENRWASAAGGTRSDRPGEKWCCEDSFEKSRGARLLGVQSVSMGLVRSSAQIYSEKGFRLGFTIANVEEQCVGDSLFFAGLAAVSPALAVFHSELRFRSVPRATCNAPGVAAAEGRSSGGRGGRRFRREARSVSPPAAAEMGASEAAEIGPAPQRGLEQIGAELEAAMERKTKAAGAEMRELRGRQAQLSEEIDTVAREGLTARSKASPPHTSRHSTQGCRQ